MWPSSNNRADREEGNGGKRWILYYRVSEKE
jgi:hypothetical protein